MIKSSCIYNGHVIHKRLKPKNLSDGLSDYNKKNLKFIPYNNIKTSKKILDKYKNRLVVL